jgi:glycosyltransferase involved in cell wall biosynthesis
VANTTWNLWNYRLDLMKSLQKEGYQITVIAPKDDYVELITTELNCEYVPLKHLSRKSINPILNLITLVELFFVLLKTKPDGIFFFTVKPNIFGNIAAAILKINTISGYEGLGYAATANSFLKKTILFLYKIAFSFTQKVVFQNIENLNEFVNYHKILTPEKAIVIQGFGIDSDFFSPKNEIIPTKKEVPTFLFLGRFLINKGLIEFVAAAESLTQKGIQAQFALLGDTDLGNPLHINPNELKKLTTNKAIIYHGFTDDVRKYISISDVIVLPSYYGEGIPRTLLEGLAMGKPVITTDTSGCRDTVEHEKNGFLIPEKDIPALAEAMEHFLTLSEVTQQAMGEYSRKKFLNEFSNENILPQYLRLAKDFFQ